MIAKNTDRIEQKRLLRVPRAFIWHALADAEEFGAWFGVKFEGAFRQGATVRGRVTHEGHNGVPIEITIDKIDPEHLFAFRWHPYAVDPEIDYSKEPPTRVAFELNESGPGTTITVVESGFDAIPATRRAEAYREHEEGWAAQLNALERYLAKAA